VQNSNLVTVFFRDRHLPLSSARLIQSTPILVLRPILILSFCLSLCLPSGLFPSRFYTKTLYAFLFATMHVTFPTHLIILNLITPIRFGEQYRSWSGTDHEAVQVTKQYRSRSSTGHEAVQVMKHYRSRSSTGHEAVQVTKQYRSWSTTDHEAVHITKQYTLWSSTGHEAVQVMKLLTVYLFLYTLFSNTISLRCSLSVWNRVSHPYDTRGQNYSYAYFNHFIFW